MKKYLEVVPLYMHEKSLFLDPRIDASFSKGGLLLYTPLSDHGPGHFPASLSETRFRLFMPPMDAGSQSRNL